ncbi:conserved hypothetical protein [Gammaproteobacteria bacterium]
MLPQEREILTNFLNRFSNIPPQSPDPEANALIRQAIRRPDAAYLLVQQALVHEIGLQQAEQRIQELEQELQSTRAAVAPVPGAAQGSFLGNMLGKRRGGWSDAPVAPPVRNGWNQGPTFAPPSAPIMQRGGGVGGFLASAAATAAGVAGGALLFEGVRNFMGGSSTSGASASPADLNTGDSGFLPDPVQTVNTGNDSAFLTEANTDQNTGGWGDGGDSSDGSSDWF